MAASTNELRVSKNGERNNCYLLSVVVFTVNNFLTHSRCLKGLIFMEANSKQPMEPLLRMEKTLFVSSVTISSEIQFSCLVETGSVRCVQKK